jgi:hypothetical protein
MTDQMAGGSAMSAASPSTLAQLLFSTPPTLNFADIVDELEAVLSRYPATNRALWRDGGDVAIFDLDGSRVVLGFTDTLAGPHVACLTVSVGTGPDVVGPGPLADRRTALCRKIADRLSTRYPYDSVVWHETPSPVTPDLIDKMIETLTTGGEPTRLPQEPAVEIDRLLARMSVELEIRQVNPVTNFARPEAHNFTPLSVRPPKARIKLPAALRPAPVPEAPPVAPAEAPVIANDRPALPQNHDADAARIRAALYPPEEEVEDERPSTQMRLAVHAMNATMIVALLPVGAAMMTYSILRGEDLRLSGRMMALTGLVLAASQSQMGQQVMSFI